MLVTPATPQTKAGGLLERRSSRPAWATEQDENRQNKKQRAEEEEVVTTLNRAGKEPSIAIPQLHTLNSQKTMHVITC